MAKEEKAEAKPQENAPDQAAAADKPTEKGKGNSIVPWIIIAAVVVVAAGAGLGLGRLFAGSKPQAAAAPNQPATQTADKPTAAEQPKSDVPVSADNIWYFDLEPVVANLDEPGATRYVRATLILEMSSEISADKGTPFLQQKKPLLTNLLTIYLSGLNVEATRGDKNLKRIQSGICDTFNERLFPDSKPLIKGILLKEFAVQ